MVVVVRLLFGFGAKGFGNSYGGEVIGVLGVCID